MLTVLFVKRFLAVFVGFLVLQFAFPDYTEILWGIFAVTGLLVFILLKSNFPTTQITVDEETIRFKREFPTWHLLKKYHLHELVIPHEDWNAWLKLVLPTENNDMIHYYLFFKDDRLRFVAETRENGDLEYWVQKKFPDRPLETEFKFGKYQERVERLKDKDRMKVF
ncbi:hypothetical protein [Fluviicola sp.]|uniref:hypothetical protein n=1 Tax=Fluviicola sp. TaxID=1917219 RepID=UPI003D26A985